MKTKKENSQTFDIDKVIFLIENRRQNWNNLARQEANSGHYTRAAEYQVRADELNQMIQTLKGNK